MGHLAHPFGQVAQGREAGMLAGRQESWLLAATNFFWLILAQTPAVESREASAETGAPGLRKMS